MFVWTCWDIVLQTPSGSLNKALAQLILERINGQRLALDLLQYFPQIHYVINNADLLILGSVQYGTSSNMALGSNTAQCC